MQKNTYILNVNKEANVTPIKVATVGMPHHCLEVHDMDLDED